MISGFIKHFSTTTAVDISEKTLEQLIKRILLEQEAEAD